MSLGMSGFVGGLPRIPHFGKMGEVGGDGEESFGCTLGLKGGGDPNQGCEVHRQNKEGAQRRSAPAGEERLSIICASSPFLGSPECPVCCLQPPSLPPGPAEALSLQLENPSVCVWGGGDKA